MSALGPIYKAPHDVYLCLIMLYIYFLLQPNFLATEWCLRLDVFYDIHFHEEIVHCTLYMNVLHACCMDPLVFMCEKLK